MAISSVMNVIDLLWTYLGMGTCVVIDLFQKREMGCWIGDSLVLRHRGYNQLMGLIVCLLRSHHSWRLKST